MASLDKLKEKIEKEDDSITKHGEEILEAVISTTRDNSDGEIKSLCRAIEKNGFSKIKKSKGKYADILSKIATECVRQQRIDYYELAATIFESKNYVNWKNHVKDAESIVDILLKPIELVRTERDNWWSKDRKPSQTELGSALDRCIKKMMEAFVRDKITKEVNGKVMNLLIRTFKRTDELAFVVGGAIADTKDMNYDGAGDQLSELFTAMLDWLQREENDITDAGDKSNYVNASIRTVGKNLMQAKDELSEIYNYIISQDFEGEPISGFAMVAITILSETVMKNNGNPSAIKPFIPGTVKLMRCENEQLEMMATTAIGCIYQQTELLIPCADTVIEVYLEGKGNTLGLTLRPLYKEAPDKVLKYLARLAENAANEQSEKRYFYMFLEDVAKTQPKKLVPILDTIMADLGEPSCSHLVYMAVAEFSAECPDEADKYSKQLLEAWDKNPLVAAYACKTLANIGRMNESMADKYMTIMAKKLATVDPMWKAGILLEMKRLGQAYKEPLKKHRTLIEAERNGTQMGLADIVQSIIDFLEDRTLENMSSNVAIQKEQLGELDTRMVGTETHLKELDEEVTEQGEVLESVIDEVIEQGDRLDTLDVLVDETVEKVEEIDHKTITNAPKWSRDVSKILNPEHEYDWRYLAVRLGYSGEDIRNWALSPDPTMAILAEWYTTHKSSDATYAILTALRDMGRTEAAEIVEKALEEADQMVPKPVDEMSEKPCPVFISYQWDHQLEVKAVKDHLEMAGYRCWMDIGQMGGGDQLFAKINDGMRAAKIVICMVTSKYAKSENCNKEVNLANLLNKPIIPILIENISWPPEGSMSMLFAQLLYIQFFSEGEYVRGTKFWPDDRFLELLGQIGYYAPPDPNIITDEYRNWVPQIDDIPEVRIVKKPSEPIAVSQSNKDEQASNQRLPTVFISYQWGKQPEIKKLFSQLTKLGFPCWLDIMQMGGGDPLYAKIDKGIRNAKVVLSCVTSKYALSANCRREVSLSDALRKPIIPLLLEDGMTWPPPGPMSMTFTQLLYIDFSDEESQRDFQSEKFDELVLKMKDYVQPDEVITTKES